MTNQHPLTDGIIAAALQDLEDQEDQEDLRLVMERKRRNGPTTRLTLEELSMLPTLEDK